MIKLYITADSFKHFEKPIKEYEKRLGRNCNIIKLKPIKNWSTSQIIEKETNNLIEKLKKDRSYKIVLNLKWKSFETKELYNFIESKKQSFWSLSFIIWWAYWLDYIKLKKHTDFELNLWNLTMPHSLALLVLLEQIYRIGMIKKWSKYHK